MRFFDHCQSKGSETPTIQSRPRSARLVLGLLIFQGGVRVRARA
jgi:hypothetical protein